MRNQKYTAIFFLFYFICSLRTYIAPGSLWDFISTNYKELVYIFLCFLELREQFAWKYVWKEYLRRFFSVIL